MCVCVCVCALHQHERMLKIRGRKCGCAIPPRRGFHHQPFIVFLLVALCIFTCVSSNPIKQNDRDGGPWNAGAGNKPLECGTLHNLLLIYFDNGATKRRSFTSDRERQWCWDLSPLSLTQDLLVRLFFFFYKLTPQNPLYRHCSPVQIRFVLIHCNSVMKFNCCEADLNRLKRGCAGICTGLNEIHFKIPL